MTPFQAIAFSTFCFLCTHNSARSILAESILNKSGKGKFQAFSAGSHPSGQIHPYSIDLLKNLGLRNKSARSKSWDEFAGADAATNGFRVHSLRRRRQGSLPDVARPADDGPLGRAGSLSRRGNRGRETSRIRQHLSHASAAHRRLYQLAFEVARAARASKGDRQNRPHGRKPQKKSS